MSWLSDSTPLVADGWLSSAYPGHGIRGADVPSTGANGPAILFPGLNLPAENDDEFRALILTRPGTLPGVVIGEDSSIDSGDSPPDGLHAGTWRGYKNGVVYGPDPSTYTITISSTGGTLSGGASLDGPAAAGGVSGGTASQISGGASLDGPAADGGFAGGAPSQISGGATLDTPGASGQLTGFVSPPPVHAVVRIIDTGVDIFRAAALVLALPPRHYATQADMVTRFGEVELVQLTNRVRTATTIDTVVLERALADADAEIDASLQPRYSLPLASVPRLLVNIACDIARYRLYEDRATDHVRRRYEDAVSMLNRIRKGEIQLGLNALQETTPSVGGAEHKATTRTFSRDTLRDYGGS